MQIGVMDGATQPRVKKGTLLLSYHKRHSFEDTTSSLRPMGTHILSSVNPHGFVNIIILFFCINMYFNIDDCLTDFLTNS